MGRKRGHGKGKRKSSQKPRRVSDNERGAIAPTYKGKSLREWWKHTDWYK